MKRHAEWLAVMALFLFVLLPVVTVMTKIKGRAGMFIWRNGLAHRRGTHGH